MSVTEDDKRLMEFAYEDSAESIFIRLLGRVIEDEAELLGDQTLATRLRSRLTHPDVAAKLPQAEQDRFRLFQRLLAVTMEYRRNPGRYQDDGTKH